MAESLTAARRREAAARAHAAHIQQADGRREDYFWLRDEMHLTREQAAAQVGVTVRTAERYEAARRGKRVRAPEWSPEETATALRTDLTARQVAALLGRTPGAVRMRRHYVRVRRTGSRFDCPPNELPELDRGV